jgi:hypothetical protein
MDVGGCLTTTICNQGDGLLGFPEERETFTKPSQMRGRKRQKEASKEIRDYHQTRINIGI